MVADIWLFSVLQGPVYKIEWSPFVSDLFLSCSADWSIRLWHQERTQPVLNFFSSTVSINEYQINSDCGHAAMSYSTAHFVEEW